MHGVTLGMIVHNECFDALLSYAYNMHYLRLHTNDDVISADGAEVLLYWHFLALQIITMLAHSCCVISIMLMFVRWLKRN